MGMMIAKATRPAALLTRNASSEATATLIATQLTAPETPFAAITRLKVAILISNVSLTEHTALVPPILIAD
jgi:hypothetical protein